MQAPLLSTLTGQRLTLEATWKYVIVCSVGIAMALLGSIFIAIAMDVGKVNVPVSFSAITSVAKQLDPMWLKAGFVFILVGYGTQNGTCSNAHGFLMPTLKLQVLHLLYYQEFAQLCISWDF